MKKKLTAIIVCSAAALLAVVITIIYFVVKPHKKEAYDPPHTVTSAVWEQKLGSAQNFNGWLYKGGKRYKEIMVVGNRRVLIDDQTVDIELYAEEQGEYLLYTSGASGVWKKSIITSEQYKKTELISTIITLFKDDYGSFTYSYEDKVYSAYLTSKDYGKNLEDCKITVRFEEEELKEFTFTCNYGGDEYKYSINIFGTAKLDLPEV